MSLDSLKGTVSGVGRIFPCSKATPEHTESKREQVTPDGFMLRDLSVNKLFTQIDVHQFSRLLVDQNIVDVSVTQADDVADCGHKAEKLVPTLKWS